MSTHIADSARVGGSAWVFGSAWVSGSAQVSGSALVSGEARVSGSARVFGSARVSDHMVIDRPDGYITLGPIGSEHRTATAAWDYKRREICVRAGCWYGSLEELEARIAPNGDNGWLNQDAERYRTQYECLIAAASYIPEPDVWPEVAS